jgi:glycosyltransferase involved in cell wall biosynthesis
MTQINIELEDEEILVSVMMNCYNGEEYLLSSVKSVLNQDYKNFEIIFWDNNSSDNTANLISEIRDKRLKYYKGEITVPLGAARNLALGKAKGDLIAFLDCDDLWLPTKLSKQVKLFKSNDNIGIVYSDSNYFDESGVLYNLFSKSKPYRGYCFAKILSKYIISLETAMIRKKALLKLDHWFDNRYQMIEEYDLFVRIAANWMIDYSDEVLAMWRVHSNSWTSRFPEKFIDEKKIMLDELSKEKQLTHFRPFLIDELKKMPIYESIIYWKNGDGIQARKILKESKIDNLKKLLILVVSFLSFKQINIFENAFRKIANYLKN